MEQRSNGCQPGVFGLLKGCVAFAETANVVGIALKPRAHIVGHVVGVNTSRQTIAQDRYGTVVARGYDISPTHYIKSIELLCTGIGLLHIEGKLCAMHRF